MTYTRLTRLWSLLFLIVMVSSILLLGSAFAFPVTATEDSEDLNRDSLVLSARYPIYTTVSDVNRKQSHTQRLSIVFDNNEPSLAQEQNFGASGIRAVNPVSLPQPERTTTYYAVPEPGTLFLLGTGLVLLGRQLKKKQRAGENARQSNREPEALR